MGYIESWVAVTVMSGSVEVTAWIELNIEVEHCSSAHLISCSACLPCLDLLQNFSLQCEVCSLQEKTLTWIGVHARTFQARDLLGALVPCQIKLVAECWRWVSMEPHWTFLPGFTGWEMIICVPPVCYTKDSLSSSSASSLLALWEDVSDCSSLHGCSGTVPCVP